MSCNKSLVIAQGSSLWLFISRFVYILPNYRTFFFVQAGVNGFRILSGDHIPSGGQTAANAVIDEETGEPEEYDYGKIKWFF